MGVMISPIIPISLMIIISTTNIALMRTIFLIGKAILATTKCGGHAANGNDDNNYNSHSSTNDTNSDG